MDEKGEANDRIAPQGVLRALIVTPTRELALQVLITAASCVTGERTVSLNSDPKQLLVQSIMSLIITSYILK